MSEDDSSTFRERFDAARKVEQERAEARAIPLDLDPDTSADFERARANVDRLLAAVAAGRVDPSSAAPRICGEMVSHMAEVPLAVSLYMQWAELSDIVETVDDSSEAAALGLLRQAATEWVGRDSGDDNAVDYFDRWERLRATWTPD